jgi:hypothetical protein
MLDKVRRGGAALTAFLPSLFVLSLLLVSLSLLVCGYLGDASAFNSDNLLSSAQCDDLLHGREMTDWHLPGAPYVFPDLLLLLPCQYLMPTLPLAFLAYCLVLHLALFASLVWLGRLSGLRWQSAILAAGCGGILLVALSLHEIREDRDNLLVHPGSHFAAIVVGFFLLALTVHSLRRGFSRTLGVVYVLVAGFGSFSDRLLVAQFLAPLAAALSLLAIRKVISVRQASLPLVLLSAAILLSCVIKLLFERLGFHLLTLDTSPGKLRLPDLFSMLRRLYQGIAGNSLLCVLIALHFLAAFRVARFWVRRTEAMAEATSLDRRSVLLPALTFFLSPLCIVGALFVLGMSHQAAIGRYTLSCWFLPPLLLPLLCCWLPGRPARIALVVLQTAIVLFAVPRVWMMWPALEPARFEQPYPPLAQALDRLARERGPLCGLGGFWTARSTSYFTRANVTVNPLSVLGEPWFHASNPARFLADDKDDLRCPNYRFLVLRHGDPFAPSAAVLALEFGAPVERIAVGNDEIWLYDSLRVPAFDGFLRSRLAERLHRKRPYTGPIEPACLARPKANMTPPDAPGLVALDAATAREVRFAQPITGQLLDIGASDEARLEVEFFHGAERLGSLAVPRVPWTGACYDKAGIQSRLLPLPALLRRRAWDRLVVRADATSANVRLGHVLVYADRIAGLEEERPLPHLPRIRLEAEELLPINPGTPFSDEADASASGGRARRAAVNFRWCFNYTPRLFLPPGRYRLECALKVDENTVSEEVVSLAVDCLLPRKAVAKRSLNGVDFVAAGRWATIKMTFEVSEYDEGIQIGITGTGKTPITVDYLDLIAEGSSTSLAGQ